MTTNEPDRAASGQSIREEILHAAAAKKTRAEAAAKLSPAERKAAKEQERALAKAAKEQAKADRKQAAKDNVELGNALRLYIKQHKHQRIAAAHGVHVFPDRIIRVPLLPGPDSPIEVHPIAGVTAELEGTGALSARSTLTRSLVPGMHGWQKKTDDRATWLIVQGPEFRWRVNAGGGDAFTQKLVNKFAEQITTAGYRAQTG